MKWKRSEGQIRQTRRRRIMRRGGIVRRKGEEKEKQWEKKEEEEGYEGVKLFLLGHGRVQLWSSTSVVLLFQILLSEMQKRKWFYIKLHVLD
jgi:hypothetical protein